MGRAAGRLAAGEAAGVSGDRRDSALGLDTCCTIYLCLYPTAALLTLLQHAVSRAWQERATDPRVSGSQSPALKSSLYGINARYSETSPGASPEVHAKVTVGASWSVPLWFALLICTWTRYLENPERSWPSRAPVHHTVRRCKQHGALRIAGAFESPCTLQHHSITVHGSGVITGLRRGCHHRFLYVDTAVEPATGLPCSAYGCPVPAYQITSKVASSRHTGQAASQQAAHRPCAVMAHRLLHALGRQPKRVAFDLAVRACHTVPHAAPSRPANGTRGGMLPFLPYTLPTCPVLPQPAGQARHPPCPEVSTL